MYGIVQLHDYIMFILTVIFVMVMGIFGTIWVYFYREYHKLQHLEDNFVLPKFIRLIIERFALPRRRSRSRMDITYMRYVLFDLVPAKPITHNQTVELA